MLLKKNTIIAHRFLTETTSILRCCLSFTTLTTATVVTEKEYNHCTQISHRNHIYPEMLPVLYNTDNCYCLSLKKNTIIAHRFLTETTSILRWLPVLYNTDNCYCLLLKKNTIIAHRFLTETTSILRCCLSFTTLTTATACY